MTNKGVAMTIRVKYDVVNSMVMTEHMDGAVELPKWNAAEALKQLKWRYPTAKRIKILQHG